MYYYYYEKDKALEINVSKYLWHNFIVNENSLILSKIIWGCQYEFWEFYPMAR